MENDGGTDEQKKANFRRAIKGNICDAFKTIVMLKDGVEEEGERARGRIMKIFMRIGWDHRYLKFNKRPNFLSPCR